MKYDRVVFSGHAIQRMFQRGVAPVEDDPGDSPYPSRLLLGFVDGRPLHVVVAWDAGTGTCIIVTAYEPQPELWEPGFRKRREQ